jgi:hypothetical protein
MSKSKETVYQEATMKSLGMNAEGTRMDIVYLAMDEYAKNQAIAFVEWCNTYGYKKYKELDRWKFDSQMNLTNEDVWNLFLTHQSQQK